MQCQAKSKRTGEQCKREVPEGARVCYYHGGRSLKGIASPSLKTGKHSKYLTGKLLETYQSGQDNPMLLHLDDEINLVDSRLVDLLSRVNTGESGQAWKLARSAQKTLSEELVPGGNMALARMALSDLEGIIKKGLSDFYAWEEIGRLIALREKLVRSQRRSDVEAGTLIAQEDVRLITSFLLRVVLENVPDNDARARIGEAFEKIQVIDGKLIASR